MGLPRSGAKGAPHLPLHHVPPGRLPPAGSASVSSAQPGPGVVVQVKDHPRPALLGEPGPLRGAPRHPAPARRSASLPGAPRAEQASAAGSAHCEYEYTNPWPPAASSVPTPAGRSDRAGPGRWPRNQRGKDPPSAPNCRPPAAATAAAAVGHAIPQPGGSSSGRPPPQPSSSSHSSPAELLLQRARRAPVGPRAAASRPQTSRLDRQPAIFRVPTAMRAGRASEQIRV